MFVAVHLATGWSMHCEYIGEDWNFHKAIALTNKCSGFSMSNAYRAKQRNVIMHQSSGCEIIIKYVNNIKHSILEDLINKNKNVKQI